jgi:hypothetical protein
MLSLVQISAVADFAGRVYHVQRILNHMILGLTLSVSNPAQTLQIDPLAFGSS